MRQKLRRWLDDIPLTDPIERRQATVFQMVLIGWIILAGPPALLPGPSAASPGPVTPTLQLSLTLLRIAGSLLWICPLCALVLLRRGRFKLSVGVATLGLLLTHSLASFLLGITNSAVPIVFQIPIALAGLLAGRRLLLTVAGLSLLVVILVGILESRSPPLAGFFTNAVAGGSEGISPAASQTLGLTIVFFVGVTLLLTLLLDRFGSALRDALTGSLEREKELRASVLLLKRRSLSEPRPCKQP
jgi:rsbT co-antagonist protein RsbR